MKKKILAVVLSLAMAFSFVACSGGEAKEEAENETTEEKQEENEDKQPITIAIGSAYAPFCYLDENENPAGYEYELFQLVADKLKDKYDIEVVCESWDNLFVGLESGKYDIVSHHLAFNEERAEKYTVSTESLMYYGSYRVLYKEGRTDISDLESLAGLTLCNTGTDNSGKYLVEFNEEHPDNPIILQETFPSTEAMIAGIENGMYDGYIHTYFDLKTKYVDLYPDAKLAISDVDLFNIEDCGTYALFKKGNTELQEVFDNAIAELRADGSMSELCIEWFGDDYSINPLE